MAGMAQRLEVVIVTVSMLAMGCSALEVPPPSRPLTVTTQAPTRVHGDRVFEPANDDPILALHAHDDLDDGPSAGPTRRPIESAGSRHISTHEQKHEERKRQLLKDLEDERRAVCPLVLSFDGEDVSFDSMEQENTFDLGGSIPCLARDWPTASTPWLVRDLNGNGTIDGGHELFGAGTQLPDGSFAEHGFEALAQLDEDGDGWITPLDSAHGSLLVWSDQNGNRRADPGELQSLEELGILAIGLDYAVDPRCDARGNCAIERGVFLWTTDDAEAPRRGHVIDVHLVCRQ